MRNFVILFVVVCALTIFSCTSNEVPKKIIFSEHAPKPIGPYSQAVLINDFLFVSGQIGINPKLNKLVEGGVENEFKQIMENIGEILASIGLDYSNIVKTSIYLLELDDFQKINEMYSYYFQKDFPARETVGVSKLPKNAKVEVSVIAYVGKKKQ